MMIRKQLKPSIRGRAHRRRDLVGDVGGGGFIPSAIG